MITLLRLCVNKKEVSGTADNSEMVSIDKRPVTRKDTAGTVCYNYNRMRGHVESVPIRFDVLHGPVTRIQPFKLNAVTQLWNAPKVAVCCM